MLVCLGCAKKCRAKELQAGQDAGAGVSSSLQTCTGVSSRAEGAGQRAGNEGVAVEGLDILPSVLPETENVQELG